MPDAWLLAEGAVVIVAAAVVVRWLTLLQRRVNDHAERIARLEGRMDDY